MRPVSAGPPTIAVLAGLLWACGGRVSPRPEPPRPRAPAADVGPTRVAVTVDDLPFVGGVGPGDTVAAATGRIAAALLAARAPAVGFVVCDRAGTGVALRRWRGPGLELGNHSASHRAIGAIPVADWLADAARCRDRLARLTGRPPRWFRHPYNQVGRTPELRDRALKGLRALGHEVAPVTVDGGDWVLHRAYVAALRGGDRTRARSVGDAWIAYVLRALVRHARMARDLAGRDPGHVLLVHANALVADRLGDLLAALRSAGVRTASLAEVLADPLHRDAGRTVDPVGLAWLARRASGGSAFWAWDDAQLAALRERFGAPPARASRWIDHDLAVRPIRPGEWIVVHTRPWPANSLAVELDDGTLLVVGTPYTPAATRSLLEWLAARFGPRRVVAVNPHFHDDAAGGNPALREAGAEIWASDHTARLIRRETRGDPRAAPTRIFDADRGLVLRFGADTVRVVYPGPGHSADNVVVHLPERRILFGGCLVIARDRIGSTASANLAAWPRSVERLRSLDAGWIVPGHGDRTDPGLLDHSLRVLRAEPAGGGSR